MELVVASAIFLALTAVLFATFFLGGRAWRKTDDRSELLRNTQILASQLAREAERTSTYSVTLLPNRAISFLSPMDDNNQAVTDPVSGDIRWQRYVIFYHDAASQEVRRIEVPLLPTSIQRTSPGPIENFISATGIHPLSDYLVDGRVIARRISLFAPEHVPDTRRLTVRFRCLQPHSRGGPDLTLDLATHAYFRN